MEEIWKNIQGYEGKYQVSNLGRIKSLNYNRTKKEKILKVGKNKYGYLVVGLHKKGKIKVHKIHRIVAEAFISNSNNYPCVNHKDEDKTNNNVENLEWCNHKYNVNYGTCQQRRVKNTDYKKKVENTDYKSIARKQSKTVLQFTKDGEFIMEWLSVMECGRNGFSIGHISACCRGKLKSHKGFIWKYKE